MKSALRFLSWMLILFVWSACEDENHDSPIVRSNVRTVLVYIVADNSLSSFASDDYKEMKAGMQALDEEGMHLLVYMDVRGGTPFLAELAYQNGELVETILKSYEENRNSVGTAETLEVFNDVFTNAAYRADSYGLVYWSHCDGWIPYPIPSSQISPLWIGQDTNGGKEDNRMNLSDFVTVMQAAPHFDFIMFDACFMLSVEVAYALRNYTDYVLASPTEIPGPGAPYDLLVPYMFSSKGAAIQMATAYFDEYERIYAEGKGISNENWTGGTSIGVLSTAELNSLAAETAQILSGVEATDVISLRSRAFNYDQRSSSSHIGYYDMQELMEQILDEDTYKNWLSLFQSCIAYWKTTPMNYSQFCGMFSMERANGVTHYIPAELTSEATLAYHATEWYEAAGLAQIGW